jgi:integrase
MEFLLQADFPIALKTMQGLQDANVDTATVALLLGHTSTKYVDEVYKRYRPENQMEVILKLPGSP